MSTSAKDPAAVLIEYYYRIQKLLFAVQKSTIRGVKIVKKRSITKIILLFFRRSILNDFNFNEGWDWHGCRKSQNVRKMCGEIKRISPHICQKKTLSTTSSAPINN
jgi:hypothetical protein